MGSSGNDGSPTKPAAPGFRFHPTDDELVSYYLKRKVLSKPFAVDAISEVDLYKVEPWDLPGKSKIQSGDTQWFFFGILDKKYSNRSKTNRATGEGYWKTTGKDRSVRRSGRTVGLKKTLVFHSGRAPKGERTNWVMHEYRLADDDLARAGVAQDTYVVCRVFHKNGPGPQNGAQYGAPFVEAEWEDDTNVPLGWSIAGCGNIRGGGKSDDRSEQEGIQNEILAHSSGSNDEKNIVSSSMEPSNLPVEVPPNEGIIGQLNKDIDLPQAIEDVTLRAPTGTSDLFISPENTSTDDFVELDDFVKPGVVEENVLQETFLVQNEQPVWTPCNSNINSKGLHGSEQVNAVECDLQPLKPDVPAFVKDNFYLELDDIVDPTRDKKYDDALYFDASVLQHGIEQDDYVEMIDILDPTPSKSSGMDTLDEPFAYFGATEGQNAQSHSFDYSDFLDFPHDAAGIWDEGGFAKQAASSCKQLTNDNYEAAASSLVASTNSGNQGLQSSEVTQIPDLGYGPAPDKGIKGRLISMLGSISSPPAFAAEPKSSTSSSIHITAGMIHINDQRMEGGHRQPWSDPKREDVGFVLSYDTARADIRNNSQVGKMHCSSVSVVVRSGYCLSFLSVLFLAMFLKMGAIYFFQVK